MSLKSYKKKLSKYTTSIPKTVKATRKMTRNVSKKMKYFLCRTKQSLKKMPKWINNKTCRAIRYVTKKTTRK